jgi:hypothetical protein
LVPDIQSKLYPHRDPDKVRRDVVRMLNRELLGRTHRDDEPAPAPLATYNQPPIALNNT